MRCCDWAGCEYLAHHDIDGHGYCDKHLIAHRLSLKPLREDRRDSVRRLYPKGWSIYAMAKALGVDESTVRRDIAYWEAS